MKNFKIEILFYPFLILISTLAITYYTSLICLSLKINTPKFLIVYSLLFTLTFILLNKKIHWINYLFSLIILSVICYASYVYVIDIYDTSWDGQWYHQDAIIKLYNGWNPIYSTSTSNELGASDMWIHHYTQGAWIIESSILKLTERIQSAKILTSILILVSFLNVIYIFLKYKLLRNKTLIVLIALAVSLNPIALSQMFSFYVDGISALLITNILILLFAYYKENQSSYILIFLAFTISIYINVKFSNLVYISIVLFGYFLLLLLNNRKLIKQFILSFSIIYILSVLVIGYSSYTKNTIEKGHPFYPLMGKGSYSGLISRIQKPANFDSTNTRFDNFIIANALAFPQYSRSPLEYKERMPFTETTYFQYFSTDSEIAGFGAIYFDILIVMLILSTIFLITYYISKRKIITLNYNYIFTLIIILNILFLSCLINDGMHVARYIPQFHLIPIIGLIYLARIKSSFFKIYVGIIIIAFLFNSYYIIERQLQYYKDLSRHVIFEMQYLNEQYKYVEVDMEYESVERRLIENKVKYIKKDLSLDTAKSPFLFTGNRNFYKGIK